MKLIQGKIAVVTGASEGIGRAISLSLAKEGAILILLARGQEKLNLLKDEIVSLGQRAYTFPCDMANPEEVKKTFSQILNQFQRVDILVNNAGIGTFKPLHLIDYDELLRPVQLPIASSILATRLVIEGMLNRKEGHIVNLTSPAGYFPIPYMIPYTTARFAMVGFSNSLAEEMNGKGIHVSLICPAQVNTSYFQKNDANMDWYPKISKLMPILEAEEVGKKVVQAIYQKKKEVIFPFILWAIVRTYQTLPNLGLGLFKLLGLFKPTAKL